MVVHQSDALLWRRPILLNFSLKEMKSFPFIYVILESRQEYEMP